MGESRGRPTVFISYSHQDEAWKDRVVSHLKVLEIEGELTVWDDDRIAAGDDWLPEISGAMNRAAVAVLLISKDFLTSGFIRGTEVPLLLKRRQSEGLRVIPLFVHPCAWEAVDWLAGLQGRPGNGRTLSESRKPQIEKHLSALALEIRDLLSQKVDTVQEIPAPGASLPVKSSSAPASERRQVTVACCELVGKDSPSGSPQAFDPETLQELMQRFRALAETVAGRYDGHLGNALGGQRLLLYFGYPQAHEDNAQRAVRAALELTDQTAQMSADSDLGRPILLALRVAVHTGSAVVSMEPQSQEPTLGSTLDLAMVLQSLAEPGEVIVSPATSSLIDKSFVLAALPAVQVPGSAVPLIPSRVLDLVDSYEASAAGLVPLVGREQELELLLSRWRLAREGNGQAILISGDAGIGKSRLVLALRERLEQSEAQWWSCFGSPFTQGSPLQPVVAQLRQVFLQPSGVSPLDQLESALQALGLADALPLFASLLDLPLDDRCPALHLSPERQREKTLEMLVAYLLGMAERQPLVLVMEDLHWLDPTSLDCINRVIDQLAGSPLLVLLTVRSQTAEALWGPLAHLSRITLAPLNGDETERLIERVVGAQSLPAAVRQQIVTRTDGVPLFVEELTKTVLESHESGELPATLRDSLAARLDRLGAAKEIAQIASVIGRVFSFELLAAVCTADEAVLQLELRRLVQAELVYRKGFGGQVRYLFKHALVQDAAYQSLLKRRRQQLHGQIAEALLLRFAEIAATTPEILAHHFTEAGQTEPAIDFWLRAGDLAGRRSASRESIGHLDRALQLLENLAAGPERDRTELRIQNARAAAIMTGRGYIDPEVEQAYVRAELLAERLGEAEERFWAVYGIFTYHATFGHLAQALDLAERLLRIAESEQRPVLLSMAWLSLGIYHSYLPDNAQAVIEMERAYELAPADDDSFLIRTGADLRVVTRCLITPPLWHLGQIDRAQQTIEQAIALSRQLGHPLSLTFSCSFAAVLAQTQLDAETVRRRVGEVHELAVELGLSFWVWHTSFLLAWAELYAPTGGPPAIELGDFDSSQQVIAHLAGSSMAYFFSLRAEILILQGLPCDAWRALDEGLTIAQERGVRPWIGELYRLQGEILLNAKGQEEIAGQGGPAKAEQLFQTALELNRRDGSKALELRAALSLGKLWKSQGRTPGARALVAQARQGFSGESPDLGEARAFLESCSMDEN
ncbi:MAG TPA: AAA family ATPase [Thermoanaerobaculia bacterium]|nr:AAA family ATPase [Thermoanaerobaculia bacterium]